MSTSHESSFFATAAGLGFGLFFLRKWYLRRAEVKDRLESLQNRDKKYTKCPVDTKIYRVGCSAGHSAEISAEDMKLIRPKKGEEAVYYHDYLKLDNLLASQVPKSLQPSGKFAHDEMLFIIIHQTYELWFKEIIHELNSVVYLFSQQPMPDESIGTIVGRLGRVLHILKALVAQIDILDTMNPIDFLDFRDFLFPASGFEVLFYFVHDIYLQ